MTVVVGVGGFAFQPRAVGNIDHFWPSSDSEFMVLEDVNGLGELSGLVWAGA